MRGTHLLHMVEVECALRHALVLFNQPPATLWVAFRETEYFAMCHRTSRHCKFMLCHDALLPTLAYVVVHLALVVFVNLLSYCAE